MNYGCGKVTSITEYLKSYAVFRQAHGEVW